MIIATAALQPPSESSAARPARPSQRRQLLLGGNPQVISLPCSISSHFSR